MTPSSSQYSLLPLPHNVVATQTHTYTYNEASSPSNILQHGNEYFSGNMINSRPVVLFSGSNMSSSEDYANLPMCDDSYVTAADEFSTASSAQLMRPEEMMEWSSEGL